MKTTTSERLKEIMSEYRLKQIDILERSKRYCAQYNIKLTKTDLSQYVSGKVEPGQAKLFILGLTLNVSEAWLMGYDVPRERANVADDTNNNLFNQYDNLSPIQTQRLPLLGEIACGEPIFCDEDRESYVEVGTNIRADFCLRAKGDSMVNARICDGDIVFIRQQPMVDNGDIAAVVVDNEATLKRVYFDKENSKLVLQAENPKYMPLVYVGDELNNIRILGRAIAFESNL